MLKSNLNKKCNNILDIAMEYASLQGFKNVIMEDRRIEIEKIWAEMEFLEKLERGIPSHDNDYSVFLDIWAKRKGIGDKYAELRSKVLILMMEYTELLLNGEP